MLIAMAKRGILQITMNSIPAKPLPSIDALDIARFWSHVDVGKPDDCWNWKASKFAGGYGQMKIAGRNVKTHRIAFLLIHGYDPVDGIVCHTCDNPSCCNGHHLYNGTPASNIADCVSRGRGNNPTGSQHWSKRRPDRVSRGERVGGSKLTAAQVEEIRALYLSGGITHQDLADRFGIKRESVSALLRGRNWKHLSLDREAIADIGKTNRGKAGEKHGTAKLTEKQVHEIRSLYAAGNITQVQLAKQFKVTKHSIYGIVTRKSWRHI